MIAGTLFTLQIILFSFNLYSTDIDMKTELISQDCQINYGLDVVHPTDITFVEVLLRRAGNERRFFLDRLKKHIEDHKKLFPSHWKGNFVKCRFCFQNFIVHREKELLANYNILYSEKCSCKDATIISSLLACFGGILCFA
ncbi:hypothetical protein ACFLY6_03335 [Candidatus Dependentiae bacterium]